MTTAKPTAATTRPPDGFRFEDPPERQPDDMTSFNHLTITGSAYLLAEHLGNRDTTPVAGKIGLLGSTGGGAAGHRVVFNVVRAVVANAAANFSVIRLGQLWSLILLTSALLPQLHFQIRAFRPGF